MDPLEALANAWAELEGDGSAEASRTTFRVSSKDDIVVWITPLVLPVVTRLLTDLSSSVRLNMCLFDVKPLTSPYSMLVLSYAPMR